MSLSDVQQYLWIPVGLIMCTVGIFIIVLTSEITGFFWVCAGFIIISYEIKVRLKWI